jgi:hypothetical protein
MHGAAGTPNTTPMISVRSRRHVSDLAQDKGPS